jgi:hypothetical protein
MAEAADLDLVRPLPPQSDDTVADLELGTVLGAMAQGDKLIYEVAQRALLLGLDDPDAISYRQAVLADCLANADVLRTLYDLAVETVTTERKVWGIFAASPDSILHRAAEVMGLYVGMFRRLRAVCDEHAGAFGSAGFTRLFAMIAAELDDSYLDAVAAHLQELKFRRGVMISAQVGRGNTAAGYVLRRSPERRLRQRLSRGRRATYTFEVHPRDEAGLRALGELKGRGVNLVANALAQSVDHVRSFFSLLASELAFYAGCVNLHEQLGAQGAPTCFPVMTPAGRLTLSAAGLYDVALSLRLDAPVVGNAVEASGKRLVVITGANQGGKSTLLRALGQAQLMAQAGMFVPAERYHGEVGAGVFTHYKREEDATMESGKLDEELARMSRIAEWIRPTAVLLCNESFASTNEREGSEIARQVIAAMIDSGVKVMVVTHLYDLAHGWWQGGSGDILFLRAERRADTRRTYKLYEGEPLPTSFGQDTYRQVFGESEEEIEVPPVAERAAFGD